MRKAYRLDCSQHVLELGTRTCIMGILNITPDSFSDGGKFFIPDTAIAHGEKLARDGADILDIGGESTKPFSKPVPAKEQIRRIIPVIKELSKRINIPISIDTTDASVAKAAIEAGASIVNDIGAMRLDPDMVNIIAEYNVPVVLMHMKGIPENMQTMACYGNLLEEIKIFFWDRINFAKANGIDRSKIIIDPGIGFGKTFDHNIQILKDQDFLRTLDFPVLTGPSRKSFLKNILKDYFDNELYSEIPLLDTGTQAVIAASVLNGAHIIRVHDVASARLTTKIIDTILKGK